MSLIFCSKCNSLIPQGSKYCEKCGTQVNQTKVGKSAHNTPQKQKTFKSMENGPPIRFCSKCNSVIPKDSEFCEKCGTKFIQTKINSA